MKEILVVGSLNMDSVANVDHIPVVGETIATNTIHLNPGGKGANQAYAVGKLGGCVKMLGAIGDDAFGQMLLRNLNSVGVETSGIYIKKGMPSGQAFITVNKDGDNSIVVISGSNMSLSINDVKNRADYIKHADIIILQLEINIDVVLYTAKLAKSLGKYVILDPAPARANLPSELYRYIDLIKPNETELSILTGINNCMDQLKEATEVLRNKGVNNVLVTLGSKGAYLNSQKYGIQEFPGKHVKAIDTTAAGDAFTAAIAYELSIGVSLPEAVNIANMVSAVVVTRNGAQESIPSMKEIQDGIKSPISAV